MDPTSHNANHSRRLGLGVPAALIPWHDNRRALWARDLHRQLTCTRHGEDLRYHEAALDGLERGRQRRGWSTEDMLAAIIAFEQQNGRRPTQRDFRSANGLPGYATLWRRFGSIDAAIKAATDK